MLLRDLVDAPRLRLRLLLEPQGALDRPVRRALTTDLLEPTRYLSGGELVLTGLNWRRSAADSETFVRSLVDGGAIALAAGDALLGSVPEDLVEACRRHGLPLLEVPEEISFADLVEHCAAATGSPAGARMSASLVRQREMLSAIASGRTLDEVAARVSAGTGRSVRVLTTTGRSVVPGREPLAETDVDRVVHAYLAAARLPVTVGEGASALTAFPVGYFTVNQSIGQGFVDWDWLTAQPAVQELDCVRHLHLATPLVTVMNGRQGRGMIFKPDNLA